MRKVSIEELNQILLTKQSFKFKPTNKEVYKFITALCNLHGIYFPTHKNNFKRHSKAAYVCVDKWNTPSLILTTPTPISCQNQQEIELILPRINDETNYTTSS